MYPILEHSEIGWIERTGYPSYMQEGNEREDFDEDALYQEQMEAEHGW